MIYYVSQKNETPGSGSKNNPFRTISQAAQIAMPGDTVIIGAGTYREWVNPKNGGTGNNNRIIYRNADGERPVITGAEPLGGWQPFKNTVWRTEVDNSLFGGYNPYTDEIYGDWYDSLGQTHHTGELFLNGAAMYESSSLPSLLASVPPENKDKALRWYAVTEKEKTIFYGDFNGLDPNEHSTEISVRPFCFFPVKEGINYITVSGIEICNAATQWAPPTAFQPGLIGPNWSRGWIIEDCLIHDSKCCGISLGKKRETKDNAWSKNPAKGGAHTYTEIVFSNLNDGWSREKTGWHIVRNNEIYNCGQTGIVGCMGGAFSDIIGNHIHHINVRNEFTGAEIAGIKLHAAIDTVIDKNVIHDCSRGLWLDWEAQGTCVRKNVFFRNDADDDLFIEVCHGPCIIANNIFLSRRNIRNMSQGTAFVHNLFAGELFNKPDTNRFTLYHLPHSTMVGGVMLIYGGDDRVINNLFIGNGNGTACYNGYSHCAAKKTTENDTPAADIGSTLPTIIRSNLYLSGAKAWEHEQAPRIISDFRPELTVKEENGYYWLCSNFTALSGDILSDRVDTAALGIAFQSEQPYENRDGSPVTLDADFSDCPRGEKTAIGPFERWQNKICLCKC